MTIEVLYPELTNIYGDLGNIKYLEKVTTKIKFVYTNINEEPKFNKEKIDFVYLGSMPEFHQKVVIKKLLKYENKIKELIDKDVIFLFTGSAFELVGKYIEEHGEKIKTLNLFNIYFKRNYDKRHNSFFLGDFDNQQIVGNKSQFTMAYGHNKYPFLQTRVGIGMNENEKIEGIHYKNFFGTYLLGPILPLNPDFAKYLLNLKEIKEKFKYEQEAYEAHDLQVKLLSEPDAQIFMGDHY